MASTYSRLNDSSTELTATSSSDVVVNVDSQDAAAAVLSPTAFVMMLLRDRMDSGVVVRTVLEYSGGALDRVLFYTRSGDWVAARIVSIGPGITLQLSLLTAGGSGAAAGEAVESRLGSRRLLPPDSDPSFRQRASAAAEMALAEDELAHMRAVAALDPPAPVGADGADGDRLLGPDHREASAFALLRSVWAVPVRVWGFAPTLHLAASLLLMWIAVEGDPDGGCTHDLAFWVAWTGLLWAPWLAVVWSLVFVHGPIGLIDELGRSASRKRMAALFAVLWALGLVWAITGAVWVFRDNKPRDPACPTNLYWGAYAGSAALLAETLLPLVFYPVAACVIVRGTWHRN